MERFRYDRSSKWLIEHHGDSILRLAGVEDVISWKPLVAEIVQPRQLPDGLLEVERRSRPVKDLYLVEIETYADREVDTQIMDDLMLICQTRRVIPEAVLLVLRPKGQVQVPSDCELKCESGRTSLMGRWPVVELWKLSAEAMLALHEPGLVPWITLMDSAKPPPELLKECRQIIDERAKPEELGNILAVSQILASLRYNDRWLFNFFGGKEAMIQTPYLKEIIDEEVNLRFDKELAKKVDVEVAKKLDVEVAKKLDVEVAKQMHVTLARILKARFTDMPPDVIAGLEKIADKEELNNLTDWAAICPDLESFRQKLPK